MIFWLAIIILDAIVIVVGYILIGSLRKRIMAKKKLLSEPVYGIRKNKSTDESIEKADSSNSEFSINKISIRGEKDEKTGELIRESKEVEYIEQEIKEKVVSAAMLNKLFVDIAHGTRFTIDGRCEACGADTRIILTRSGDGFRLQGGMLYALQMDQFMFKCEDCYAISLDFINTDNPFFIRDNLSLI